MSTAAVRVFETPRGAEAEGFSRDGARFYPALVGVKQLLTDGL